MQYLRVFLGKVLVCLWGCLERMYYLHMFLVGVLYVPITRPLTPPTHSPTQPLIHPPTHSRTHPSQSTAYSLVYSLAH